MREAAEDGHRTKSETVPVALGAYLRRASDTEPAILDAIGEHVGSIQGPARPVVESGAHAEIRRMTGRVIVHTGRLATC